MQLTIKTLKGQTFNVQIEPNQTVQDLKAKIKQLKNFQIQSQKIVYKGKATNNTDILEQIGVKQGQFLVIMVLAKKPQPKAQQKKQQKVQEQKQEKKQKAQQKKQNPKNQSQINELMSMGFPRDQCEKALAAAFNNTDRAVQYLLNGVPEHPIEGQEGQQSPNNAQLLAGLVNMPQFAQIRQVIRTNPAALQPILQQLSQTSPQLYNVIAQNPELFERLIIQGPEGMEGLQQGGMEGPPGSIVVTHEEEQAIKRLMQLGGVSKIEAAQAYLACDKNEQMAANLLFDRIANGDIEDEFDQSSGNNGGNGGNEEDDDNLFG